MPPEDYLRHSPIRFDSPDYQACFEYWCRLKGARKSPKWSEWDWFELPVELIPYFLIVDVRYDPMDFVYRFWGTASVSMHGIDMTHQSIDDIRSEPTALLTRAQYQDVVDAHEAIGAEYSMQAGNSGPNYMQITLRMPFSDDTGRVTQIATYCDWSRDRFDIRQDYIREYGDPAR